MKKITYLAVLFSLLTIHSYSQQDFSMLPVQEEPELDYKQIRPQNSNPYDKAPTISSTWFNYFADLRDAWGVTSVFFRTSLFPDSTVVVQNGSSFANAFKHSYGQVLDPTSQYHQVQVRKESPYTLDSIAFPYRYFRIQKGAPDTLVVSIFKHNQLNINAAPGWSTPRSYANAPYDTIAKKGSQPFKEIVIALTDQHEMSEENGIFYIEVDMEIAVDEIVAATFSYFPGNPWFAGDTLANTIDPAGPNTRNCFNIFDGQDQTALVDNGFYNMGQWVTTAIRYNLLGLTNGWEGSYIPGVAYGNSTGVRHMDVNFKLTYEDFTGITERGKEYNFAVSPNPFREQLNFKYDLKVSDQAVIEIYNVLGKKLKVIDLNVTEKRQSVDLSYLPAGIYFARLTVNDEVITSSKIIKE